MSGGPGDGGLEETVERARKLDKVAVSRLIGVFEDARPAAATTRARALELLDASAGPDEQACMVLGVTGTPGSGKSSLLARLTVDMLAADPDLTIAVLAIDPSSPISGGSLLGDRTRMRAPSTSGGCSSAARRRPPSWAACRRRASRCAGC